ncbi:uncharacterized protein LTR77_005770 [Saxophila tyrrhenica]|uniref:Autophagy-related protein n=1 Tax=Saxophila tyrrhenica TaxID=1690608 RepID=A0AAV9PCI4_9PEZI|nr:hypothetical protein LTR77_005770 [Saxophila tyrrhenica]
MGLLLAAYTIYVDTLFAVSSVSSQLFVAEIRPGALEYSLYSLAQVLCIIGCQILFLYIRPLVKIRLETWLITGYALSLLLPLWGIIGFADVRPARNSTPPPSSPNSPKPPPTPPGKSSSPSSSPPGAEIRWLTLQVVLSCGTVWLNYVASAPLQNATHELRFPLVLSAVLLCFPVAMEVARGNLAVFRRDREEWAAVDGEGVVVEEVRVEGAGKGG